MVDLPNLSVMTMGIDAWEESRCVLVQEARLLGAVQKALGPQVKSLRKSPIKPSEIKDPYSAEAYIGIPVKPFPRWFRCVKCGLLSSYDLGLFEFKDQRYRPDRTKFIHIGCQGSKGNARPKDAEAVPARFLLACRNGHLDDFPWHYFVHNGKTECKGTLRFSNRALRFRLKISGSNVIPVEVLETWLMLSGNQEKRVSHNAGGDTHISIVSIPIVKNVHERVLLGATNSWFPITVSVLAIPTEEDPLIQCINDGWEHFHILETKDQLDTILRVLISASLLPGIERFDSNDIWQAIEDKEGEHQVLSRLKKSKVLNGKFSPKIHLQTIGLILKVEKFQSLIHINTGSNQVLLVERLREVNALLGFTRIAKLLKKLKILIKDLQEQVFPSMILLGSLSQMYTVKEFSFVSKKKSSKPGKRMTR